MSDRRKVVVIIDDDAGVCSSMKSLLSSFGYVVCASCSAEAFLETAPASKADCLIVDVQLGGITGVELVRELRAQGFNFPIIFMTGSDNATFRNDARQLGCVAYLQKPCASHMLIEAIVKATGASRA
jgi:FixJ family two-component response regulator